MHRAEFNEYVHQHSRKLFGYAFRILQNQEESEDAVQEVFIKLWNMRDKLKEYKSIDALSITMTKNYCIDQWRKNRNVSFEDEKKQEFTIANSPSPHEKMEQKETNEILHRIIDHLPDLFRDMVKLRDIEGLAYEEIAEKTGQNINTLRVTLSRARKLVRDEFNKNQYEGRGIKQIDRKVL